MRIMTRYEHDRSGHGISLMDEANFINLRAVRGLSIDDVTFVGSLTVVYVLVCKRNRAAATE